MSDSVKDCIVCNMAPRVAPYVCAIHKLTGAIVIRRDGSRESVVVDANGQFTPPVVLRAGDLVSLVYEYEDP